MQKRVWVAALLVLLSGALGSARVHEAYRVIGTIEKWDGKTQLLSIKTAKSGVLEILLNAKTKITKNKMKMPVLELKKGRSVVVDGIGDDIFELEAVAIQIVPALPAKK